MTSCFHGDHYKACKDTACVCPCHEQCPECGGMDFKGRQCNQCGWMPSDAKPNEPTPSRSDR